MITNEQICKVLHSECLGPWHDPSHEKYRETESHHYGEHNIMATKIQDLYESTIEKVIELYL